MLRYDTTMTCTMYETYFQYYKLSRGRPSHKPFSSPGIIM